MSYLHRKGLPPSQGLESLSATGAFRKVQLFEKWMQVNLRREAVFIRAKRIWLPRNQMRDPIIYRIIKASHHRTGEPGRCTRCMISHMASVIIFWRHHSFSLHPRVWSARPLYDWLVEQTQERWLQAKADWIQTGSTFHNTMMSKGSSIELVREGKVSVLGWSANAHHFAVAPRGYTTWVDPGNLLIWSGTQVEAIMMFSLLEHAVRDDLNIRAPRVFAVLIRLR